MYAPCELASAHTYETLACSRDVYPSPAWLFTNWVQEPLWDGLEIGRDRQGNIQVASVDNAFVSHVIIDKQKQTNEKKPKCHRNQGFSRSLASM